MTTANPNQPFANSRPAYARDYRNQAIFDYDVPGMRSQSEGTDANQRLSVLLRLQRLWGTAETAQR